MNWSGEALRRGLKSLMDRKYRKKVSVKAEQWFKNGDHSEDQSESYIDTAGQERKTEGRIVRHYHKPDNSRCPICGRLTEDHGWLDRAEIAPDGLVLTGDMICPGDWIATDADGKRYRIKEKMFKSIYEATFDDELKDASAGTGKLQV